jgi:hypothetical protein
VIIYTRPICGSPWYKGGAMFFVTEDGNFQDGLIIGKSYLSFSWSSLTKALVPDGENPFVAVKDDYRYCFFQENSASIA